MKICTPFLLNSISSINELQGNVSGLTTIGLIRRGTPSRNGSLGLNQRIQRVQCGNNAILFPSLPLSRRLNLTKSSVFRMASSIWATDERAPRLTLQLHRIRTRVQFLSSAVTAVFRGELAKFSSCLKLNFPHLSANWTQRLRRDIFSRRSRSLTTADYAQRASCACCV